MGMLISNFNTKFLKGSVSAYVSMSFIFYEAISLLVLKLWIQIKTTLYSSPLFESLIDNNFSSIIWIWNSIHYIVSCYHMVAAWLKYFWDGTFGYIRNMYQLADFKWHYAYLLHFWIQREILGSFCL